MKYEFLKGRLVINTFKFFLLWVDLLKVKERTTLVFDLGWCSVAYRIRR